MQGLEKVLNWDDFSMVSEREVSTGRGSLAYVFIGYYFLF